MLRFVYDASGNVASQTAESIVLPQIIGQPVLQVVEPGQTASFSVVVSDASGVTFRWKFNGSDIPGATGDTIILTSVGAANEGQYSVVVTNSVGSVTSASAALMLDSDQDGLPDKWEIEKFGNLTGQRSEGDPDDDDISNLDEFLDGTHPNNSASLRPRLIVYSDDGGSVTITPPMKLNYEVGESVTLTAVPLPPNVFVGWAGDLNIGDLPSATNPVTFAINGNKTVRARFASVMPPPSGMVAWWKAENDFRDVMEVNPGTLGAAISFGMGKVGRAFLFDNDTIKVSASETLNVGAGDGFTLEAWIKPATATNRYPIFEWNDGSAATNPPPWGVHLWIGEQHNQFGGAGSLFVNIVDTTKAPHIFSSPKALIRAMVWQHIALTYDRPSGISRLFLNGVQVASENLGTFVPLTTADLYIGHRPRDVFYSGLIDEPTIYNRALRVDEVFSICNADFLGKDFTAPYFTSSSKLPDAVLGASYTHQLTTILGTPPISFSVSAGALPPGIALSSAGVLSGNPGARGTFDFTVLATDAAGKSREQLCVLRVL